MKLSDNLQFPMLFSLFLFLIFFTLFLFKSPVLNMVTIAPLTDTFQVFYDLGYGFNEQDSVTVSVSGKDVVQKISFNLPSGMFKNLRIDPGTYPLELKIYSIELKTLFFNKKWIPSEIAESFNPANHISRFEDTGDFLSLFSTGNDPHFVYNNDIRLDVIRLRIFDSIVIALILFACFLILLLLNSKGILPKFSAYSKKRIIGITSNKRVMNFIFVLVVLGLIFYLFRDFLLFKNLFMFADIGVDTIHIFFPGFHHLSDYIKTDGFPLWSFNYGIGENIAIGRLSNIFYSVIYLFNPDKIPYLIIITIAIQIFLSGLIFYKYLKVLGLSQTPSVIGAVLYAFCGHLMIRSGWYYYALDGVLIAFMLLSFELLFRENKWYFMPVSVFLGIVCRGGFHVFQYAVILFGYSIIRYFMERRFDLKEFVGFYLKFIGIYLIGIGMGAFVIIDSVSYYLSHPRISTQVGQNGIPVFDSLSVYLTQFMSLFSPSWMGVGSYFRGVLNFLEAPAYYIGILPLIVLPQLVFIRLDKKRKNIFILLFFVMLLYMIFPIVRYIFAGFSSFYYFKISSFWISIGILFVFLFLFEQFIKDRIDFNSKGLIFVSVAYITLIVFLSKATVFQTKINIAYSHLIFVVLLIALYTLLLLLFKSGKNKSFIKCLLLALVLLEISVSVYPVINNRIKLTPDDLQSKRLYNDGSVSAIELVKNIETNSIFYRMEKDYMSVFLNDSLVQDYWGTKAYSSFNHPSYINFLYNLEVPFLEGDVEGYFRYIDAFKGRFIPETILSLKYKLTKDTNSLPPFYVYLNQTEDIYIYSNKNFVPFGSVYNQYIMEHELINQSYQVKEMAMLNAAIIESVSEETAGYIDNIGLEDIYSDMELYGLKNDNLDTDWEDGSVSDRLFEYFSFKVNGLRENYMDLTEVSQKRICGVIKMPSEGIILVPIPYDKGWRVRVNGERGHLFKINYGLTGMFLSSGEYELIFEYYPPFLNLGILISSVFLLVFFILAVLYRLNFLKNNKPLF